MGYDKSGTPVPSAQSQWSLVACSLLGYGNQSKVLSRCQGHSVSRDAPHRVFCDGLGAEQYNHSHSLPHIFDRYSYPSQGQLLQRLNILGFGNPFVVQASSHPSSWGVPHLLVLGLWECNGSLYQLLRTWGLVFALLVYPLMHAIFLVSSLGGTVFLNSLAFLYEKQKSLPLLLVAKQGYQSYFWPINQVSSPYSHYNIQQEKAQAQ